ncbi:hypothetical protein [Sphingosinicella humi]|uniref:DUF2927 domain-containing protein n=1 Tax=Allosphingosinicella humi TaxID=2068657 RepID=A0A2U2J2K0_9SPHN|nr:hypothetical protein [Sphingosinicella humi]PWG02568.1 hypothetical protein DF286_06580 [Sphingosinicella humi]
MRNSSKAAFALLVAASPLTVSSATLPPLDQAALQLPSQTPEDRVSDPITVTGTKVTKEVAHSFVREVAVEAAYGQLARWNGPICLRVQGLKPEYSAYIKGTIIAFANEVRAEVARPGCKINLVVAFESDPADFITVLNQTRSDLFDSMSHHDLERMTASTEAVRTWSRVATKPADGAGESTLADSGVADLRLGGLVTGRAYRKYTNSTIEQSTRQDLYASFITIDLDQIEGKTMQQLSAYVAMLALAQVDVANPIVAAPTILNLFHSPETAPSDFTDWDIAYVRSLYDSNNRLKANMQQGTMANLVRRELADAAKD